MHNLQLQAIAQMNSFYIDTARVLRASPAGAALERQVTRFTIDINAAVLGLHIRRTRARDHPHRHFKFIQFQICVIKSFITESLYADVTIAKINLGHCSI